MLTTQSAALPPRIHTLYTDLPAPTRRAANIPFLAAAAAPRPAPPRASVYTRPSRVISFAQPAPTRRAPPPPPRRVTPPTPRDEGPFADPVPAPAPMSYARAAMPPPAAVPAAPREVRARAVACMILSRGGPRPMRRRLSPGPRPYVRSGLSAVVAAAHD